MYITCMYMFINCEYIHVCTVFRDVRTILSNYVHVVRIPDAVQGSGPRFKLQAAVPYFGTGY